jgi:hypothetical protein
MTTTLTVVGIVIGGLAVAIYYIQHREVNPASGPYVHFRCPFCNKKLRFPASKAGKPGMCPCCRRRWTMPATSETSADSNELVNH